jgi:hypothetical protein
MHQSTTLWEELPMFLRASRIHSNNRRLQEEYYQLSFYRNPENIPRIDEEKTQRMSTCKPVELGNTRILTD